MGEQRQGQNDQPNKGGQQGDRGNQTTTGQPGQGDQATREAKPRQGDGNESTETKTGGTQESNS